MPRSPFAVFALVGLLLALPVHGERAISPVRGEHGMVVAGHPAAAAIGQRVLADGGNAMDAVVATSLALGVAEPYGSGLGGKGALLYYDAATDELWFVDGMDAADGQLDVASFRALTSLERAQGVRGIAVPGLLAALEKAHRKWGREPWAGLVTPAAQLAAEGVPVLAGARPFFAHRLERVRSHPETTRLYAIEGDVPPVGAVLANPDLAATLRRIACEGAAGFYEGPVAAAIVEEIQAGGGSMELADLATYEARLSAPLRLPWEDFEIVSSPPPTTGGSILLLSLKAFEDFPWPDPAPLRTAANLDAWSDLLRVLYPQIQRQIADVPAARGSWEAMSRPEAIEALRAAAFGPLPSTIPAPALVPADPSTTHFVVADRFGNVASVTQSLSHHFGSGVIAPGTGVLLNNSLTNFSLSDPAGVNFAGPGKRPRSTITPTMVLRDGRPILALGLPGGQRIPTSTLLVLLDHLAFGRDLGAAIVAPRAHLVRSWSEAPDSSLVQCEYDFSRPVQEGLRALGWEVETITNTESFGGFTALQIAPDGTFTGWADPRRTNHAAGF